MSMVIIFSNILFSCGWLKNNKCLVIFNLVILIFGLLVKFYFDVLHCFICFFSIGWISLTIDVICM